MGGLTRARLVSVEGVSETRRCFGAFISARKIPFPGNGDRGLRDRFDISGYWAKVPSLRSLSKAESPIGKRSRLRSNET
jgi:hypothetical protein